MADVGVTGSQPRTAMPDPGRPRGMGLVDITDEASRLPAFAGHEQVLELRDDSVGATAFIAIHDTTLGPALGGCRAIAYADRAGALTDALRLSRGMSYKASLAGLDLGGGKAVVACRDRKAVSEPFFRRLGEAIESLDGRYITAEDSGTSVREMDWIARETEHVIGSSMRGGDPSPVTSLGVLAGIRTAVRHRLGTASLSGVVVAIQGLGHVGATLAELLAAAGARLVVTDIDGKRAQAVADRLGVECVPPDAIHRVRADVFAPCALGGVLDSVTIPRLRCAVIGGSANNQLAGGADGLALSRRGILYAPDYAINAGGLIFVGLQLKGEDPDGAAIRARVRDRIVSVLTAIFARADAERAATASVADRMAEERLVRAGWCASGLEGKTA